MKSKGVPEAARWSLDNRAKHYELQVEAGTVATAQVMLADSLKEHMSDCRTSLPPVHDEPMPTEHESKNDSQFDPSL